MIWSFLDYRMLKSDHKHWRSIWRRRGKGLKNMKGGKIICCVLEITYHIHNFRAEELKYNQEKRDIELTWLIRG